AKATIALALLTDKVAAQHIKTGETELALGNYDAALEQFNAVLEMDPKNKRALRGKRDTEKAIENKRYESLAKQQKEIKQKLADADKLLKDKKYKDALSIYRYVLAIDPASSAAIRGSSVCENIISEGKAQHGGLGDKYLQDQKVGLAVKEYALALSFDQDDTLMKSKYESAGIQLQNAINPLLDDARNYEDKEQFIEALKSYNAVLVQDGENNDAIAGIKRMESSIEKQYESRMSGGKRATVSGDFIKAAQNYMDALSLKPGDDVAQRELSRIKDSLRRAVAAKLKTADKALDANDFTSAVAAYDEVLSVDENNLQAIDGMQKVKAQLTEEIAKKLSSAESAFRNGQYFQAHNFAGDVLAIDRDNKVARNIRTESRQKMSLAISPILKKALDDYNRHDLESAVAGFKRVLNIDPTHETAKKYLSKIDQSKVAKSVASRVKKLYDEGIQFYIAGEYAKAIKNWEQVLELDPRHEKASANIKKTKKKMEGVMDVR
ncbi:MAG: tetratricopeptide repeat protein, partial [Nitrospirota bacterium]|nr:tetratricopeptide repeat protein [Nitrospirota bacterium]